MAAESQYLTSSNACLFNSPIHSSQLQNFQYRFFLSAHSVDNLKSCISILQNKLFPITFKYDFLNKPGDTDLYARRYINADNFLGGCLLDFKQKVDIFELNQLIEHVGVIVEDFDNQKSMFQGDLRDFRKTHKTFSGSFLKISAKSFFLAPLSLPKITF